MYWWAIALFVLAIVFYGYSVSSTIKVAKPGCSSCPASRAQESSEM